MLRQRLKPEPLRKSEADRAVAKKKHSAPELLDELPDDSDAHLADPVAVRKKAMDFLARREYGRGELENKLCKAGFDAEAVAKALAHLTDEGLQSDERFAESFMQSRINQKVKFREGFRPFAPAVLAERVADHFEFDAERGVLRAQVAGGRTEYETTAR